MSENLLPDTIEGGFPGIPAPPLKEDVLSVLVDRDGDARSKEDFLPIEVSSVQGLLWALKHSGKRGKSQLPLSREDAFLFHHLVMSPADQLSGDIHLLPGQVRDRMVEVGSEKFIPPRPEDVQPLLGQLFESFEGRWERQEDIRQVYWDAAWFHFFFEKIHPFADGNGRVGRVLVDTMLRQRGLRPISNWVGEVQQQLDTTTLTEGSKRYITAIEETERLRLNRWVEPFSEVEIPGFREDSQSTPLKNIGDDYLLPLVVHMLTSGLENEREFLSQLEQEKAENGEISNQRDRVDEVTRLLAESQQKLRLIETHVPDALEQFDLVDPNRRDKHTHPLWWEFIPPSHP
ncbi:hypothetical protein CMO96_01940 [Candidatus Woesebacteria bacterium]|nr:hypothetical protein [Candidatus Woesebacteria bacterium]|tara:strand:- start:1671 stop:2708 length:1038 start_codon:yes stop_codon:yes gene_type:complete